MNVVQSKVGGKQPHSLEGAAMPDEVPQAESTSVPLLPRLKFACVRMLLWLVVKCTSLSGLYLLGQAFGTCEWLINYKRRRRFHERMRRLFGQDYRPQAMRRACRRYFTRTRCDRLFYLVFDLLPRDKIIRRIHFPQRHVIDASLARGKGVYVALSHCGAHHVAGLLMCFLGYEVAGVRDRQEGALRRYIQEQFNRKFSEVRAAKVFFADEFPREIYRWLQCNRIVGSALDVDRVREPHLKRLPVVLFGETREYLTGTLQIALRCKAAAHQGFIVSRARYHYEMIASEPLIDPEVGEDTPELLQQVMQQYAANIERHLRAFPDHISRI